MPRRSAHRTAARSHRQKFCDMALAACTIWHRASGEDFGYAMLELHLLIATG